MIFVVDDEQIFLTLGREALKQDGLEVETFERAADALKRLEVKDPDLIISDIMMPEMDGFAFKDEVTRRFPEKDVPFIFLSSLGDPEQLIRGLEADVDDYLVKPIEPTVLKARVKSLLRRRKRSQSAVFQGDLGHFPFIKVVQFCEQQGLTGEVVFSDGDWKVVIPFKGGSIQLDDLRNPKFSLNNLYDFDEIDDADDILERLYDLDHGRFTIRPGAVDFSALKGRVAAEESPTEEPRSTSSTPMGRLSGIKIGERLFQIQTEMVQFPEKRIVTVVVLDGNTVLKRSFPVEGPGVRSELQILVEQQHKEIEEEVRRKVENLGKERGAQDGTKGQSFFELFDAGFEAYRNGNLQNALEIWLEAQTLNPDDPTLKINLKIVRSRIEMASL
jgi:CheY-like chemotaxis protein